MGQCISKTLSHRSQPESLEIANSATPPVSEPSQQQMIDAITSRAVYASEAQRKAHISYLTKGKPGETPMPGVLPRRAAN